jgi:hypothetical protein
MTNKKMILGIAAGVAALAVVGLICKRKGYLDTWCDKADELTDDLKDKYQSVKESARKRFDEVVQKGGEIADKIKTSATESGPADPATT